MRTIQKMKTTRMTMLMVNIIRIKSVFVVGGEREKQIHNNNRKCFFKKDIHKQKY